MGRRVGHLWFSEKQKNVGGSNIGRLTSGEEVEYTEMTTTKLNTSLWDDKIHLGEGSYVKFHTRGKLR